MPKFKFYRSATIPGVTGEEIGQAERVRYSSRAPISYQGGTDSNGSQLVTIQSVDDWHPVEIVVTGWQTPLSLPNLGTLLNPGEDKRIRDYEILLLAMVRQFGGAVIVSEVEMIEASKMTLEANQHMDGPKFITIKAKE